MEAPTDGGASCGGDPCMDGGPNAFTPRSDAGRDAVALVPRDVGAFTRIDETTAAAARTGCTYERGAWPWETLGTGVPIGDEIPIHHFILLMQENRSFDEYFGTMPGVDGIPPGTTNPDGANPAVASFHATEYCTEDTNHEWNGSHLEYHDGANDGFVTQNNPMGARAMGYLNETDIPFYWDLAQTFAMSDHHHCSLLGPTWPNRDFYLAATSFGSILTPDPVATSRFPGDGQDYTIFQALNSAGVSWHIYYRSVPYVWGPWSAWGTRPEQRAHQTTFDRFYTDLAAGDLDSVVWIDPSWTSGASTTHDDEHPPANPQYGQAFIRDIVTHVMDSPIWNDTAIIFTYDENGGFYDHVPPPAACPPGDGYAPNLGASDYHADFDRLGFRVPLIVVSPYARTHYVSDHVTDHTSILRLLEARYSMPALTSRDANAWPMTDMFDFSTTNTVHSSDLAAAPIDAAHVAACAP
jgi:phospholipase C